MLIITRYPQAIHHGSLYDHIIKAAKAASSNLEVDIREEFPTYENREAQGYRVSLRVKSKTKEYYTVSAFGMRLPTACRHGHKAFLLELQKFNPRGVDAIVVGVPWKGRMEWYPPETAVMMFEMDRKCHCEEYLDKKGELRR